MPRPLLGSRHQLGGAGVLSRRAEPVEALSKGTTKEGCSLAYNVGSGQGFSVREVVETCRRMTGHPIPAQEGPRRPGDAAILVADSSKIGRELGWEPRYSDLGYIVETAWRWHRSHPQGYGEG